MALLEDPPWLAQRLESAQQYLDDKLTSVALKTLNDGLGYPDYLGYQLEHQLMLVHSQQGDHYLAISWAQRTLTLLRYKMSLIRGPLPSKVQSALLDVYRILSISTFYTLDKYKSSEQELLRQLALEACEYLIFYSGAIGSLRNTSINNILYYNRALPSIRYRAWDDLEKIEGYSPSSPSLMWLDDELYCNIRYVNYQIDSEGRYTTSDPQNKIKTRNFLYGLTIGPDLNWTINSQRELTDESMTQIHQARIVGQEDLRLLDPGYHWGQTDRTDRTDQMDLDSSDSLDSSGPLDPSDESEAKSDSSSPERSNLNLNNLNNLNSTGNLGRLGKQEANYLDELGDLLALTVDFESTTKRCPVICLCSFDLDGGITHKIPLRVGPEFKTEKNWLPFCQKGVWYLIYSFEPLTIYNLEDVVEYSRDLKSSLKSCWSQKMKEDLDLGTFRGSAPPVPFKLKGQTGWLMTIHQVYYAARRRYVHRFVWLSTDWKQLEFSSSFYFSKPSIEYNMALTLINSQDYLISYSVNDASCHFKLLSSVQIEELFKTY